MTFELGVPELCTHIRLTAPGLHIIPLFSFSFYSFFGLYKAHLYVQLHDWKIVFVMAHYLVLHLEAAGFKYQCICNDVKPAKLTKSAHFRVCF